MLRAKQLLAYECLSAYKSTLKEIRIKLSVEYVNVNILLVQVSFLFNTHLILISSIFI